VAVTAPLTGSRSAPSPAPRFALPAARGRALAALGAGGALLIAVGVALTLTSDHAADPAAEALTGGLLMATWIGTGLFAWSRRPHNGIGPLMVATGYTAFLGALGGSSDPVVSALGAALTSAFLAPAVHMLLAFPSGRVETRAQRRLLAAAYAVLVPAPVLIVLFSRDLGLAPGRPENGLLIADAPVLVGVVEAAAAITGVVLIAGVAVVLVRRWRAAAARERRALTPVLMTGLALIGLLAVLLAVQGRVEDRRRRRRRVGAVAALAAVPFAFLLGLVRSRSWRTGAVTELVEVLGEAPARGALRDALADALGDPSLELAFWLPDDRRYVDADGRDVRLPAGGGTAASRRRSSATGAASARSSTTPRCATSPSSCAPSAPPRRSRCSTSASTPSCGPGSRSCGARASASSRRAWPSAGAWSATCTTAPSSASSRSPSSSGSPRRSSRRGRRTTRPGSSWARPGTRPGRRWRTCASSLAGSTRRS
jgi:hypothetical protein